MDPSAELEEVRASESDETQARKIRSPRPEETVKTAVDLEEIAKLESDKLSRRLVENAAMEAQLVSKVLAAEAQFQRDRRASVEAQSQLERGASFTAAYAGAAKYAASSAPSSPSKVRSRSKARLAEALEAENLDRGAPDVPSKSTSTPMATSTPVTISTPMTTSTPVTPMTTSTPVTPVTTSTPVTPSTPVASTSTPETISMQSPRAVVFNGDLVLICGALFALAVYMLSAWLLHEPRLQAAPPIACSWDWRTLRCLHGCKMLLPGRCKRSL